MEQLSRRAFGLWLVFTFALFVSTEASNNTSSQAGINEENGTYVEKKPDSLDPNCNQTLSNGTCTSSGSKPSDGGFWNNMTNNRDMLLRTMYVLLAVTSVVIVYFVFRTCRLRQKRNKSRKYGVITTRGDVEMEPLGHGEDEDEDYTVFEMNGRHK